MSTEYQQKDPLGLLKEFEMKKLISAVTISVCSLSILSCSVINDAVVEPGETISFETEPSFSLKVERVKVDKLTMVMAVDNSGSMVSKTAELEKNMKGLFTDLIDANWDVDLHLVTCAYYKEAASSMKSVSTLDLAELSTQEKVAAMIKAASPKIDPDNIDEDADERCNQSLEKAWSVLEPKNKINLSLVISNEDGCGRKDSSFILSNRDGSYRENCAPVTFNQVQANLTSDATPLKERPVSEWVSAIEAFSNDVWIPWFNRNIKSKLYKPEKYVDFFKNLEKEGSAKVENFSHIYLPIVVDSSACLAETFAEQYAVKEAHALLIAENNHIGSASDFKFEGLKDTSNIVGNVGYSYLETFKQLDQAVDFNRKAGDLSLCNDMSHIVGKISQEIKVRGSGFEIPLPRVQIA